MSFVTLGGVGDAPTFFEMVAAERLMPSLKAAVMYSLSVYAQRRPGLNQILDHEHELFFLISVLLDRQALLNQGASFAESLYGLRRASTAATAAAAAGAGPATLSPGQRRMSLILLTLLPYLRAKLDALYLAHSSAGRPGGVLGLALQQAQQAQHGGSAPQDRPGAPPQGQWLRLQALRAFVAVYPWVNAAHEGARFWYQLFYLLGRSRYFSPELHLLQAVVARVTGQEAAAAQHATQQQRQERLHRAWAGSGPALLRMLRAGWARASDAVADHTRSALILSVFAFKLLEWWYTSAEQKLGGHKALPPPPPPPPPAPHPKGVPLPPDRATCPLCTCPRTNPALVATSGYVFCYPCIYRHVQARGCCPVTRIPAGLEHVRRLYQAG